MWPQIYDPLGNAALSTLCAALPVIVLLGSLGIFRVKAHNAALLGLGTSLSPLPCSSLACPQAVGLLVLLQAYVPPFTSMVVR